MDVTIWSAAGLAGVAFYIAAYGALQLGLIRGFSVTYTVMNMIAAGLVLLSLTEAFNLSSALVQMAWIVLSVIGLIRMAWARSTSRFSAEERGFLATHFASLPPHLARRFLNLGHWQSVSAGTILTRQGAPVRELVYIADGSAEVRAHGATMAELGPGALIGEMTVMHGATATADVEIATNAYIFTLPRKALLAELEADHAFALAVSGALQAEAGRKIDASNRTLADQAADAR